MVGAIADDLLVDKSVGQRIHILLDGITLTDAAELPDDIKDWDKHPATAIAGGWRDINKSKYSYTSSSKRIQHRSITIFIFVDIPVVGDSQYSPNTTGCTKTDVVQMIDFCIRVLKGQESENNSYKITKPVAIILLAHYVGDIHQPLHVGAEYFDANGQPVNPDTDKTVHAYPDKGGNDLELKFFAGGRRIQRSVFTWIKFKT